jgi:hypothetical protein
MLDLLLTDLCLLQKLVFRTFLLINIYTLDKIANAPIDISLIISDMNAKKNKYNILIVYYNTENKTSIVANLINGCFDYCL